MANEKGRNERENETWTLYEGYKMRRKNIEKRKIKGETWRYDVIKGMFRIDVR